MNCAWRVQLASSACLHRSLQTVLQAQAIFHLSDYLLHAQHCILEDVVELLRRNFECHHDTGPQQI